MAYSKYFLLHHEGPPQHTQPLSGWKTVGMFHVLYNYKQCFEMCQYFLCVHKRLGRYVLIDEIHSTCQIILQRNRSDYICDKCMPDSSTLFDMVSDQIEPFARQLYFFMLEFFMLSD